MPKLSSFVKICVEKVDTLRKFLKNNWQIIFIELLTIIFFTVFYGRYGDIMVDSFREVYIPLQILEGKTLYKDIFVIYPPLAYLINAILMKIFNSGLNVLYFAGLFSTMGILFYTYKIANLFINKNYTIGICLFIISGLVLSPNVFNSFLPYSYGLLYGVLFILISIYYCLDKKFPISYLFYSLAILSKYEFVLLLPLLIYSSKKNDLIKNLLYFISPIILTLCILFLQGLRWEDIKATSEIINLIGNSKTLYWFYSGMGLSFRIELIPIYLINIIKFLFPIYWIKYQEIIVWIFPLILFAGIFEFRSLNKPQRFFIIATLLISIKVFFALNIQSYGVYFLPFALISLFILTPEKIRKYLTILLIIWSFILGGLNINLLCNKKTDLNNITEYIKNNTKPTDRVIVYPECLAINILSNRQSDNKFYSLIPLYVETFGEDLIIKRLEKTKPEYIIVNDYDTSAYYYKKFGKDYAKEIYLWIKENYTLKTTIKNGWSFEVYKIK